jgi:hypothetical protein
MGMARVSVIIFGFTALFFCSLFFGMEEYRAKRDAYLADHGLLQNDDQSNELQFEMHYGLTSGFRESNGSTAKLGVMLSAVNFGFSYIPVSSLFEQMLGSSNVNYYLAAFTASGGVLSLGSAARYAYKSWNHSREIKEMDEIKKYLVHKG